MTLRYPGSAVATDCLRCAFGLACTAGPLTLLTLPPLAAGILGAAAVPFALFAVQSVVRGFARVELDDERIASTPPRRTIAWGDLEGLRLAYYSVRREGGEGWMELKLRGAGRTIRVDSRLARFREVVRRGLAAARARGLELDRATLENLDALALGGETSRAGGCNA